MNSNMEYRGYHAKIEYSAEDKTFVGRVLGINDTLAFDGETVEELENMFHDNIDDYLIMCKELGKEPDKEYRGSFNVRLTPELDKEAVIHAESSGVSLNQYISEAIRREICGDHPVEQTIFVLEPKTIANYATGLLDQSFTGINYGEKGDPEVICKKSIVRLPVLQ